MRQRMRRILGCLISIIFGLGLLASTADARRLNLHRAKEIAADHTASECFAAEVYHDGVKVIYCSSWWVNRCHRFEEDRSVGLCPGRFILYLAPWQEYRKCKAPFYFMQDGAITKLLWEPEWTCHRYSQLSR
jgi:hypothetical protein